MIPCETCKQPEECTGTYPLDDKHRPGEVRGCFADKARGVSIRSDSTAQVIAADRTLSKDLDAYKRLRDDGLQPPRIDGSAEREKLGQRHEIEQKPSPKSLERLGMT